MQIDVGFSNKIVSDCIKFNYPTILDMPAPKHTDNALS